MKTRHTLARAACAGLLLLAGAAARAGCWAAEVREPISNDGLPIGHASFAPLHRAMDQLGAMARADEGLNALPEAAGEPCRLGSGPFRLPTAGEANKPLKRIVKLDPAWGWDGKNRTRVQAIHVCPSLLDRTPDYGPPMRQAVQGLDFARIAALLN